VISKQYSGVDWSCDVSVTYYYNIEIFLFFPPFMTSGDTTFFHCWWWTKTHRCPFIGDKRRHTTVSSLVMGEHTVFPS
jgi:hypothetical protein